MIERRPGRSTWGTGVSASLTQVIERRPKRGIRRDIRRPDLKGRNKSLLAVVALELDIGEQPQPARRNQIRSGNHWLKDGTVI